jgi:putative glutathione S-transferase
MAPQTTALGEEVRTGRFVRRRSDFRDHPPTAEAGRYHLYVAPACPWSHRAMIVHRLNRLEDVIAVHRLDPYRDERGWAFTGGEFTDPLHDWSYLGEAYAATDPRFEGRISVPVLWDAAEERIVNNESADIVRILDLHFGDGALHPEELRTEMERLDRRIYADLQNAVYEAGFAGSQEAYEEAAWRVFATLEWLEDLLGDRRYLAGDRITASDWRVFPTLVRFDAVYVDHFRCNLRRLVDSPNLWGYTRELYQRPGIAATVEMDQIRRHYYTTHDSLEPSRIIPIGPELDFLAPHGRDARAATGAPTKTTQRRAA